MTLRVLRSLLIVALVALAVGCASGPAPVSTTAPAATRPSPGTATAPVTGSSVTPPAVSPVDGLVSDAGAACSDGDIAAGLARLDRALRIDPRRAAIYLQMARCYRRAGDDGRAAAAAERGLAYCGGSECRSLRQYLGS